MLYPNSALFISSLLVLASSVANAGREFSHWEEFDLPNPVCERPISLGVGRESFFEIANDVPGQFEYNQIVGNYRNRKWEEMSQGIEDFRANFESNPLREAVAFIEVQALFEQAGESDEVREKLAEKKLRNTLLLYPKSEFAPVITATAAAYWLRTKNYQRSLGAYEAAAAGFPKNPLFCTYQMGIAENHFQLRQWKEAEFALQNVLKTCGNFRLRSAAVIRKADADWLQGKAPVEKEYERILSEENPFVERFYQPTLANLGEIKFGSGKWSEAKAYFDRYLQTEREESPCKPFVMKRLADISVQLSKPHGISTGLYLATFEKYPNTDVGRLAYAHALLSDPALKAGAELDRRIRIADEQAELIKDEAFRSRIYLEKGLTLLDLGHSSGLEYVSKLRGKTSYNFEQGHSGRFIRAKITKLFEAGDLVSLESEKAYSVLEQIGAEWLKGSEQEPWVAKTYSRISLADSLRKLESGKINDSAERLRLWQNSKYWPAGGPSKEVRSQIGNLLLRKVYLDDKEASEAFKINETRSAWAPVLEPDYKIVLWLAELSTGNKDSKKGWMKWERDLAATSQTLPKDQTDLFRLASARGLRWQGNYAAAAAALEGVKSPEWKKSLLEEKLALARVQHQGERVFELLKFKLESSDGATKKEVLKEMAQVVAEESLWSKAVELSDFAKNLISERTDLAVFYHLAGRALFETNRCKQALPYFENALRMNPESTQAAESRFRTGKCFLTENKKEAARQEWQKVVDLKDSFWSPLAQGEIKLLSP